ncbi:MAG: ABC transporter substrate-binding protein [Acidimicrobiia bacterium]|nr:ABC transporter substrate-binding protein [Acidimicrobiia bacterium]
MYLADVVKATKVNILYVDNPPGLAAADAFGRQVLAKKGVTDVRLIPEKADTADFTAALTAASEGDPDAIMVLFPASGCGRIMQAKQALGVDVLTFYPGSCLNRDVLETGGEGAEGAYFNSELLLFSDEVDPEVATYREKLEQYGPGTHELSMFSQVGFLTVMNIVEVLNEVGDPAGLTSQAVIDHMRTLKDHHSFMAHPYTCDAKQVAILPAICSTHERIVQYRDGQAVDVLGEWLTGADQIG